MFDLLLQFLGLKGCTHPNVATNKIFSYCPDCGKLIHINWYVIKCRCCGKKRIGIIRGNKVIPVAKFCTNCGCDDYIVEKIENLNFFNMNYAIAKKEVETTPIPETFTETWVDEDEILKCLNVLPEYLN